MVRSYPDDPVDRALIRSLISTARRGPSAGHTAALAVRVRDAPATVGRDWEVTVRAEQRNAVRGQGLLAAPVLIGPCCSALAYVERYAEPDKAGSDLGRDTSAWSVPYWYVDGGAAVMLLLLAATDAGLGALFFGQFGHTGAVKDAFAIPDRYEPLGTIAVGHPAPEPTAGRSAGRPRRALDEVIHRGSWSD